MSWTSHNSKDMSGDGAFIPEFQTRPSHLSNLQAQCFSLRNKYVPCRLAGHIWYILRGTQERKVSTQEVYLSFFIAEREVSK